MNENEVMEMLAEDISRLRLPPISEKVLLAMREKRREFLEMNKPLVPTEKPHKIIPTKYIFAAMLALLAVSVPIIVVMTNHSPISDLPNAPVLPGSSEIVSVTESQIVTSTEEPKTALEQIKLKQIYGEVALSGKSEEELEMLLVTYSKENSVYEDDRYIYNFDSQGRLVEMRNLDPVEENGSPANVQEVSEKAMSLLKEYYSVWINDEYSMRCEEDINSNPVWYVYFTKSDGKQIMQKITMTFDKTGTLRWMIFDGTTENIGIISKAEAVRIVLNEIRSGEYDILEFDNKEVDITVRNKEIGNKQCYEICVERIPYEIINSEINFAGFIFLVDTDTRECSLVAHDP